MPDDRHLVNATPGQVPTQEDVQQLVEAERGMGTQGILRSWQASDSDWVVLTSDSSGVKISRDNGTTAPTHVVNDGTAAGGALTGTYPNPTLSAATIDALLPPGTIWAYGGAAAPAGWLLCDGAEVSRTTYPKLFAAIAATYGSTGASTFTLPDLRGRVVLGASGSHALGTVGGSETAPGPAHTHPGSHSHGLNSHTHGMSSHVHSLNNHAHSLNGHQHTVSLAHDHLSAHPTGTSIPNPAGTGTGGGTGATFADAGHFHTFDAPALGATSTTVAASGTANTGINGSNSDVAGPSTTEAAVGATATDATAAAASYPGTIAILPRFGTANYIIRTG